MPEGGLVEFRRHFPFMMTALDTPEGELFNRLYEVSNHRVRSAHCTGSASADSLCRPCSLAQSDKRLSHYKTEAKAPTRQLPMFRLGSCMMKTRMAGEKAKANLAKLQLLNAHRKILHMGERLDDFTRVAWAAASGNIKRLHALFRRFCNTGMSVSRLAELAETGITSFKGYTREEHELSYLSLKLGGRRLLHALAKAGVLPNSSATTQLLFGDMPELSVLSPLNLAQLRKLVGSGERRLAQLHVDETAIRQALRFDPRSNRILGTCIQHCSSPTFESEADAKDLVDRIANKQEHLATNLQLWSLSQLSPSGSHATPLHARALCHSQTAAGDHDTLVSLMQLLAQIDNVRISSLSSDGASSRHALVKALFRASSKSFSLRLAHLDSRVIDLGEGLTADFDWRHLLKRWRNKLAGSAGIQVGSVTISTSVIQSLATVANTDVDVSVPDKHSVSTALTFFASLRHITNCLLAERSPDLLTLLGKASTVPNSSGHFFLFFHESFSARNLIPHSTRRPHIERQYRQTSSCPEGTGGAHRGFRLPVQPP